MEKTKFYKGVVVRSDNGTILLVTDGLLSIENRFSGVVIDPGNSKLTKGYHSDVWRESIFKIHPCRIFIEPIEEQKSDPKPVLTEWQRKRLMECCWMKNKFIMDDIESILSQPEPPKWEPKQGEAVLARNHTCEKWRAFVANGERTETYPYDNDGSYPFVWNYCIPFDPAKVGTVTD